MSVPIGGLRARLIRDSVYFYLQGYLTQLDWFQIGQHFTPINFVNEAQYIETEIPLNTLALSEENLSTKFEETGSQLSEFRWNFYCDFFGENDSVSIQVINDVATLLEGRFVSLGQTGPVIPVYDYTQATPPEIFSVFVENVRVDRAHGYPQVYLRHWTSVQFQIVDNWADSNG